jgi:hypothetical protein
MNGFCQRTLTARSGGNGHGWNTNADDGVRNDNSSLMEPLR